MYIPGVTDVRVPGQHQGGEVRALVELGLPLLELLLELHLAGGAEDLQRIGLVEGVKVDVDESADD